MPSASDALSLHGQQDALCHLPMMHHAITVSTMCHPSQPAMHFAIPPPLFPTYTQFYSPFTQLCYHRMRFAFMVTLMCYAITVSMMCDPSQPAMHFAILVSTMPYPTSATSSPLPPRLLSVFPYPTLSSTMCYHFTVSTMRNPSLPPGHPSQVI